MALQVDNARLVAKQFDGAAAGVCLDRGDFIGQMNTAADDGLSMLPDVTKKTPVPARALLRSWKAVVPRVAEVLRAASMVLWLNPDMGHRIDMYAPIDGICKCRNPLVGFRV